MSANQVALSLSRRERPLHPRPQGSFAPAHGAPRQPVRHRRHGDRRVVTLAITQRIDLAIGALAVGGVVGWLVGQARPDDADAGAGGRDALARRPRRRAHRHCGRQQPDRRSASPIPIPAGNRVELFIGTFVGAMTFSGSVIAFGKLAGLGKKFRLFSSAPVVFKGQHMVNLMMRAR